MNGAEEYKEKFIKMTERRISKNSDIDGLEDFYYYLLGENSPSSTYNYLNYVINFIRYSNITNIKDITLNSYNKYLASLINDTPSYRIAVHTALKKFSAFLAANKICEDYMLLKKRPQFSEKQETIIKRNEGVFSQDEINGAIKNILSSNKNDIWKQRDYVIVLVLLSSGIRCSALCKLDLSDINFTKNSITVTEKRNTVREILLPQKTINELELWLQLRKSISGLDTNAVFVSNQKTRMSQRSVFRLVNKYTGKHPHVCRSTYGTTLYKQSNGDLYLTQMNMGHSNPKTTELYIRGENDSIKEKAVNIMDNYLNFV